MSFLGGTPVTAPMFLPGGTPVPGGGYPSWDIPPTRYGVTPGQGWGTPPGMGQPRVYLLRSGQYASCVHEGGLSYLFFDLFCFVFDLFHFHYRIVWCE